ncbi:alkene reductase [Mesobaculum littorinae]|uniref:Alkene reductase n=1 Tax=Mesobaculum littorinae TaxID=2486419 RepID=A0A438AEP1_9RHOB|nr:alkene reductase [Mesobaculum littorinae]RVV97170.1 alkene reductase [Mesobaculum littorinae]
MTTIWTPITVGSFELSHRLAMAPMTRSRAQPDGTPGELAADYYAQRAGLGLLITEGTQPSDAGQGYPLTPGIYTDAHVDGWKQVADAVHAKRACLFIQLMHVGRISHPDNAPGHRQAVAPSAIASGEDMFTLEGMKPMPKPRAMSEVDIEETIADFANAAHRAVAAGADGVEIHGANGYLVHQFLAQNANRRDDAWGGSLENRSRFAIEVARAVSDAIGPERTGIRLSPGAPMGGIDEGPESDALYRYLVRELDKLGLAYLHLLHLGNEVLLADIRDRWSRALIVNRAGGSRDRIGRDVESGLADMESYATMVLANPDFVERVRTGAPFNDPDKATFYGGGAKGYTDYPRLEVMSAGEVK